jgi:hypothetical protein
MIFPKQQQNSKTTKLFFSLFFYFYFLLDQNTETNENKLAKIKPKKKNLTKLVEK